MLSKIKTLATTGAIASGLLRRRKNPDVSKDLESSNVASTQETRERIADDVEKITRTRVPSESELAGFEGTYADFAGSREYATKLSALLKGNYRGRLKYHEKKLSQKFFSLLSSDPNELAAGLRLLTDLLMDVQDSHFHTERTGIKFRADIFDDWYFSILSRYGSLDVEKRKEARANLRRLYENEMRSPFVSRDRPVRGLAGSLLFSFSEFEGRPDTAFVTLGSEGERFSGFGLRITSKNAKTLFSWSEAGKSQLWFSRIEGDIGIPNVRFSRKAAWFTHFLDTLNADENENWYSGNIEKRAVQFSDNAAAYSWFENSCAFGRVVKQSNFHDSTALTDDLDKFWAHAALNSTPWPLGHATVERNSFFRGEFTTGGRFSKWSDSGRSLVVGSDHSMQTDDFVLYHAYCNDSLNYAFVSRGLARAKFRQGFSRAFVLRGLERAHFENAGLAAIFLGLREREIGKGATWSGTALTEGVFIGPNCFSSSADRVSSSKVSGQQEDSLYRAIILDSAFSQREFIGNTLRSAEFLLGAQGSSFGEFSAKEAIAYPGSLSRATVLPWAFFSSKIFGGFRDADIRWGFQTSVLSSNPSMLAKFGERMKAEIARRTNVAYHDDRFSGASSMAHNRTCEDIAKSGISEVITWIDRVFSAQSSVPDVRYPFLGSKISGDDTLGHAFVSKGDFVALSHNLPIIKERKRTGASYFVVEEHDISNLLS